MFVTQKCQYAIRAVFELAKAYGDGALKIVRIADHQAIPPRFLEVILNELKHGGFVESRRGSGGGYLLTRSPSKLTVGDIIRFLEGGVDPVDCFVGRSKARCSLYGNCVFQPMWRRVAKAVSGVYDATTFQQLLDEETKITRQPDYSI